MKLSYNTVEFFYSRSGIEYGTAWVPESGFFLFVVEFEDDVLNLVAPLQYSSFLILHTFFENIKVKNLFIYNPKAHKIRIY